jgi:hypothetical protein
MAGFNHAHQAALLAPYVGAFLEAVPGVVSTHEHAFSSAYVARLFPTYRVEPGIVARARALVVADDGHLPALRRLLLEEADDVERAIACRAVAEA